LSFDQWRAPHLPVPASVKVCGLVGSESPINILPDRVPVACGVNVMLIVQLAPPASEAPQVFVWVKSPEFVPPIVIPVTEIAFAPRFVRVTALGALAVPAFVEGNATNWGEYETEVNPVPLSATP
jgi:hypothetical protein